MKLLQINLNRSGRAQDLMYQYMHENKTGIALVSELTRIPGGNWIRDATGLVAIHWGTDESYACALIGRGRGYVAVESKGIIFVSMYCSPNIGRIEFDKLLADVDNNVITRNRGMKIILGGILTPGLKYGIGNITTGDIY